MGRNITKDQLIKHKDHAIQKLDQYLTSLLNDDNPTKHGKADKLSYWLEDWIRFLSQEDDFSPRKLRRYKRGEIIKIHLGFNIGSEEGGLHYAVVVDNSPALSSPVLTIIPLTSIKPSTDLNNLRNGQVFLGNELFTNLNAKVMSTSKHLTDQINELTSILDNDDDSDAKTQYMQAKLNELRNEFDLLNRMRNEVLRMKSGSIALVNQIRTISKLRVYDPKTNRDILSGIKLSNEKLDMIDAEIRRLYVKKN